MADDMVTRLHEQAQAPALAWLTEAAAEIVRLRAVLDVIDAQHQPYLSAPACQECQQHWPCGTHLLIHSEEARRG